MSELLISMATISPNTVYLFNKNLTISSIVTFTVATSSTITFKDLPGNAENYPNIKIIRLDTNQTFTFTPKSGSGETTWQCSGAIFGTNDDNKTIYLKIYS